MGGRVNYGPILIKFCIVILDHKKLTYVEFHRYIRIFKQVMAVKAAFRGATCMGAIRKRGPILPIFNTKQTLPIRNIYVKFQSSSSFHSDSIVLSTGRRTDMARSS